MVVFHQQQDAGAAGAADVDGQLHAEIIRQRRVDEHNVKLRVGQSPAGLTDAANRGHRPIIGHGEQRHDAVCEAIRCGYDQHTVCFLLEYHTLPLPSPYRS